MENKNYKITKDAFERIMQGESEILIAKELGISVQALYKRFQKFSLLISHSKRHSEDTWKKEFTQYNLGKPIKKIAKDLGVKTSTVYNHFNLYGYRRQKRIPVDKLSIFQDYKDGLTINELASKYKRTPTYIRYLIRTLIGR